MKKQTLTIAAFLILFITSCKESKNKEQIQNETNESLTTENLTPEIEEIYQYTNNKDTILLKLDNVENTISGKLDFLPNEKDSRKGTISNGQFKGDTLFAIYSSMQEEQKSECEIAFLKKGDSYILTNDIFKEINYQYNSDYTRGSFKNRKDIKFDGEILKLTNK